MRASLTLGRSKVQVMSAGVAAGRRFCPGPSNPAYGTGDNELPVQQAVREVLRPGEVFYDVGANVGFFTVIAAAVAGPAGKVFAFEPVPLNFAYLEYNCRLNDFRNVECVEAAIGSSSREETLLLAEYSGGAALESAGPPPDLAGAMRVPTFALDDWVAAGLGPLPNVVKIDVEGAELEVLRGMAEVLNRKRTKVVLEVDGPDEPTLDGRYDRCCALLRDHGYTARILPDSYPGNRWRVRHAVAEPA
jgi:FkbM family methyltransferase